MNRAHTSPLKLYEDENFHTKDANIHNKKNVLKNATNYLFFDNNQVKQKLHLTQTNSFKNFETSNNFNNLHNQSVLKTDRTSSPTSEITKRKVKPSALNLEEISIREEKLYNIVNTLRNKDPILQAIDDYFNNLFTVSLPSYDILFTHPTSQEILVNQNLEIISVTLILILFVKLKLNNTNIVTLQEFMFNHHQLLLSTIDVLLERVNENSRNSVWFLNLKSNIMNKKVFNEKTNLYRFLLKINKMNFNSIRNFIGVHLKQREDKQMFDLLTDILYNIDQYEFERVFETISHIRASLMNQYTIWRESQVVYEPQPEPYLPPLPDLTKPSTYTLVLDLDETLVHFINSEGGSELLIRPGAEQFIKDMSQYYEIVVFTAAVQDYADWILDILDKDRKYIKYRLYRHHAILRKNTYIKDISKLGRDLAKTIIIDNVWDNFQLQKDNGIFIKTWLDDQNDTCLMDLAVLLKDFVKKKVKDVRVTLRRFRDTMTRLYMKGDPNPYETLRKSLEE